jgi:hypothetical protein
MAKSKYQLEFERLFSSELERHRELVTDALKVLLETEVPSDVKILLLECHSYWYAFPVSVFALDEKGEDEVYFKKPFSTRLVAKERKLIRERVITPDQLDQFEDKKVDTFKTAHIMIADWIASIWEENGGDKYPIAAYITAHDSPRYLDLRTREWVRKMKAYAS